MQERCRIDIQQVQVYNGTYVRNNFGGDNMGFKQVIDDNISIPKAKPVVKWAGGKQQLWNEIVRNIPNHFNKYIEPFLGGGAIFLGWHPKRRYYPTPIQS